MNFIVDSLLMGNWIEDILAWICMWIDSLIYGLLSGAYSIFIAICKVDFGVVNDMFNNLLNRIYLVLGLFMLFKISFSLLQMMVSPEKATDSKVGGASLARHIFVSIIMLIAFPLVFELLGNAQRAIIDNGVIEKIVLGESADVLSSNAAGPSFSWTLFSAFFHPADSATWAGSSQLSSKARTAYNKVWDGSNYTLTPLVGVATDHTISYTPLISTIVGIAMIFFLISFSFDVGARIFKLMFLEIMAPIPIISYMDPNKGEAAFNKYRDEYVATYLELFLRLAIIYLSLLLANKIMALLTATGTGGGGAEVFSIGDGVIQLDGISLAIAKVILIIALFNFAKKLPDLINSIFGFKAGGSGGSAKGFLGAMGALGLGAAGAIGGAAVGGIGSAVGSAMRGEGFAKGAANALAGAGRGAFSAGRAGLTSKPTSLGGIGKAFTGMGGATAGAIRRQGVVSEATSAAGGWWNMTKSRVNAATGGEYRAKRQMEGLDSAVTSASENFQKQQSRMSALEGIRATAESEYAKSMGMSVADARKANPSTFDADVDSYMSGAGASNAALQTALTSYNTEHGTAITDAASLTAERTTAMSDFSSAARTLSTARSDKKSWEGQMHGGRSNKERMEGFKAAQERRGKK